MVDSAKAIIVGFLDRYGLGALGDWAWSEYLAGVSVDQIMLDMRDHPLYKQRFPAMEALAQQGRAISEAEYMAYETSTRQILQSYGVPQGMYDTPGDITRLLLNDVSVSEVNDRIQTAAAAAYTAPAETRQAIQDRFGVAGGDLIAFWLDPDKALPIIQQQYQSAQITGASRQQKVSIDYDEADRLAANGITYQQALAGFRQVASTEGLAYGQGETAGTAERVAGVFGDAAAQQKVTRVVKGRQAGFRGGGQAAEDREGVTGLGSSRSE